MSESRSVIVCGGGIVGLCAAHYLARATLLERNAEGAEIEILQGSAAVLERDHPKLLVQAYHLREGKRTLERCSEILQGTTARLTKPADRLACLPAGSNWRPVIELRHANRRRATISGRS